MDGSVVERRVDYAAFAEWLDYPTTGVRPIGGTCETRSPEVNGLIDQFVTAASGLGAGRLEEAYTQLFDLQPEHTLNLSHHLFDDEWKRSTMLIELKALCARHGIDHGSELPDHLCWLLRLVAVAPDDPELAELRTRLMLPAVRVLHERVRLHESPYPPLLHALYLELGGEEVPT